MNMTATRTTRAKPVSGHKRASVSHGIRVNCECGWHSGTWYGKGASSNAHGEWRWHVEQHAKGAKPS